MELVLAALSALRTLVSNPKLGGGGLKSIDTFFMIGHIIQLAQGGAKTAAALKEFTSQIEAMAASGYQPTSRDFDGWTSRLDSALAVIAEAKARLQEEEGITKEAAETAVDEAVESMVDEGSAPTETAALAALDKATDDAQAEQIEAEEPEEAAPVESKSVLKRKKTQRR